MRRTKPQLILELGTASALSASYMAAALRANGSGRIISIDLDTAPYDPRPVKVLERVGLSDLVELVRVPDSSYVWLLKQQVAERSDEAGNCNPVYEFVFVDGAHEFTIDGLAAVLATKLLKQYGWILFDDLNWTYSASAGARPFNLSADQINTPRIREVFDLIVRQDPSYDHFEVQDDQWAWAHKGSGPRRLTLSTTERFKDVAVQLVREAAAGLSRRS